MTFANVRACGPQELVSQVVACVRIAHADRFARGDANGKAVALVNIKDSVLTHHGDEPG